MYIHEIMHWAPEYHVYIYISILSGCAIKPEDGVCFHVTYLQSYGMIFKM